MCDERKFGKFAAEVRCSLKSEDQVSLGLGDGGGQTPDWLSDYFCARNS